MIAVALSLSFGTLCVVPLFTSRRLAERVGALKRKQQLASRRPKGLVLHRRISSNRYARWLVQLDPVERSLGLFVFVVFVLFGLVRPLLVVMLALACAAFVVTRRRARSQALEAAVVRDLPLVTDVLALSFRSGLNVTGAFGFVVRHFDGPVVEAMSEVLRRLDRGERFGDALMHSSAAFGGKGQGFVSTIVIGERYGAPLAETLERYSLELRSDQFRRAEQASRRLSVQLLFPLAGCLLPAFVLLTAVPLLAGSIGSLAFFH